MAERGYEAVTVEDIARQADIANATFFLHFPTKASLLAAFNEEIFAKVVERIKDEKLCAVEKLEAVYRTVQDEWRPHQKLLTRLMSDESNRGQSGVFDCVHFLEPLMEEIVQSGQRNGQLSLDYDARVVSISICAAWQAINVEYAQSGDAEKASAAMLSALSLILKGAMPRETPPVLPSGRTF